MKKISSCTLPIPTRTFMAIKVRAVRKRPETCLRGEKKKIFLKEEKKPIY